MNYDKREKFDTIKVLGNVYDPYIIYLHFISIADGKILPDSMTKGRHAEKNWSETIQFGIHGTEELFRIDVSDDVSPIETVERITSIIKEKYHV